MYNIHIYLMFFTVAYKKYWVHNDCHCTYFWFFNKTKISQTRGLVHPTLQNITANFAKTKNKNAGVLTRLRLKALSTRECNVT